MEKKYTLGIIGAGNMASAIVGGILASKILEPNKIIISDLDEEKLNIFKAKGLNTTFDNNEVCTNCENLLFAVKPQISESVISNIRDICSADTIISIMAGVSIEKLQKSFGEKNYARIMPNTPALVGEGMSCVAFSKGYKSQFVLDVFASLGKVVELDEELFDAVTSLSGSGPAYVYLFIKALIDGGVEGGLDFETAKTLAIQTVRGSAKMVEESPLDIDTLISNVCSKGGTTIEAINSYKNDKFEDIVKLGMRKCKYRSEELAGKHENDKITIYTDGACSGNPGVGGWAAILMYKTIAKEISGADKSTTNNRMELQAIIEALKQLKGTQSVDVYSDSAYALNAFLEGWVYNWEKNGWKTTSGSVKNDDLWKELLALTRKHAVTFHKVKGHADNEFNNRCDELAKAAIVDLQQKLPFDI